MKLINSIQKQNSFGKSKFNKDKKEKKTKSKATYAILKLTTKFSQKTNKKIIGWKKKSFKKVKKNYRNPLPCQLHKLKLIF